MFLFYSSTHHSKYLLTLTMGKIAVGVSYFVLFFVCLGFFSKEEPWEYLGMF